MIINIAEIISDNRGQSLATSVGWIENKPAKQ